jgi:peptide/nickel transport system ATP-binding protein
MRLCVKGFSLSFERYDGLLRRRSIKALDHLTFDLEGGEVLAVIGASGAGKSLLAHALFGILPPNASPSGHLSLDDIALNATSLRALRGRRMGLVPQSIGHLDPLARSGQQLQWAARRCGRHLSPNGVKDVLARFDLDGAVAASFPHQLSGGMARRLLLAIATIGSPDLIMADEPTSGLDSQNSERLLEHLRDSADKGAGVLLITHDLAQALPFADRVALLSAGRLIDLEPAAAFAGEGTKLKSSHARALWRAMPQNGFEGLDLLHA